MNDLEKMSLMAKNNQDIRLSGALVEAKTAKGGDHVTIGVDAKTINDIVLNGDKFYVVLYVINKDQFKEL